MSDRDVELVAEYADMLQIGARNMQNFALLKALGKCGKPVLLKRGLSSTIKELLMSAEYIVAHGNPNVILCERGIRTFETATRNTCDLTAVPVLNELTHLPVIVDPSHATGKRSLVPALSRAAVAIGADGLIVEVHPCPEKAISDGAQSLRLPQFEAMMKDLQPFLSCGRTPRVTEYRCGGVTCERVLNRSRRWHLVAALIVLCAVAAGGVYLWRINRGATPAEMASYLPTSDSLLVCLDVQSMRRSGLLDAIAGPRGGEDADYRQFIDQTGFNYRDDLNAVAVAIRQNPSTHERDSYIVASGDFDWSRLAAYARSHGGDCRNQFCRLPASQPHRFVSFYPIRRHLLALASSADQWAALLITHNSTAPADLPADPVWMLAPAAALQTEALFPEGTRAYASALQGAQRVAFTLGAQGDHLALSLDVTCANVDQASALLVHLEQLTETLRTWIAREHMKPNPGDLSGVLTSGAFRRDGQRVYGTWPLAKEFIQSVSGGGDAK